jgi:hypothetical protein
MNIKFVIPNHFKIANENKIGSIYYSSNNKYRLELILSFPIQGYQKSFLNLVKA